MNMKTSTKPLALAGVFAAAVFAITRFIQIPIPFGYFNIGNSFILFFCLLLPTPYAIATLIPLFGYTFTGMIIAGSFYSGLAQFPGLLIEYLANLVLFFLFYKKAYPVSAIYVKKATSRYSQIWQPLYSIHFVR